MVLHTGLPEGLAHITTGHGELQSVFAQRLGRKKKHNKLCVCSCELHPNVVRQAKHSSSVRSHPNFVVQFDEEMFALEAQLSNLCPAEGVDFGVSLLDQINEVYDLFLAL